ncbi:MAG: helix-hairpin-helix domain-containing protein [Desulfobacteraceae bacterium]|nr:helix-hairpin-helix domain-containing protein [Desulfobacteraceae bacterium]
MLHPIHIIADHREQQSGVIAHLKSLADVAVEIRTLPLGDYQVDQRLIFERKSLRDLQLSIIDGRFFNQAIRLAGSELKGVLILEGTSRDLAGVQMRREAMQGALIFASLVLGLPVLRSMDPLESAQLMVYAARQIARIDTEGLARPGHRPRSKRGRQLYILQGIPGIGRTKARRLLEKFGSVEAVVTASFEELQAVAGIGPGIAQKIRWSVSEPETPFDGFKE